MNRREFIDRLKAEFKQALQHKTGWGRQEVWVLFIECLADVLAEDEQSREEVTYGDEIREAPASKEVDEEA